MSIKSFLKKVVKYDKAVYWPPTGYDDSGIATTGDPEEIPVRWTDKQVDFIDKDGNQAISQAEIITDRQLEPKGILWHGKLTDLQDEDAAPVINSGAREIRGWKTVPDLKNNAKLYLVYL